MHLILTRISAKKESTLGFIYINGGFECYTLEDPYQHHKIPTITRISAGTYKLGLRREGGLYQKYSKKFGEDHPMIWLKDVPEFQYIYIHIGNWAKDTSGCIIVGSSYMPLINAHYLLNSTKAYLRLRDKLLPEIDNSWITILDTDRVKRYGGQND